MSFSDIFTNYWDMALMGFIGGLTVYLMSEYSNKIKNKLYLALFTFLIILILVLIYSLAVWFFGK